MQSEWLLGNSGKHISSVVVSGDQGCGADCLPQGVKTVREEKRREKSDLIIIVLCVGERVENVPWYFIL